MKMLRISHVASPTQSRSLRRLADIIVAYVVLWFLFRVVWSKSRFPSYHLELVPLNESADRSGTTQTYTDSEARNHGAGREKNQAAGQKGLGPDTQPDYGIQERLGMEKNGTFHRQDSHVTNEASLAFEIESEPGEDALYAKLNGFERELIDTQPEAAHFKSWLRDTHRLKPSEYIPLVVRMLTESYRKQKDLEPGRFVDQIHYFEIARKEKTISLNSSTLYGHTLENLKLETQGRKPAFDDVLITAFEKLPYTNEKRYTYDPYTARRRTRFGLKTTGAQTGSERGTTPCNGPDGRPVDLLKVFRGAPAGFPRPAFGSYEALGLDSQLCFDRDGRMGPYGYGREAEELEDQAADWGILQRECALNNTQPSPASSTSGFSGLSYLLNPFSHHREQDTSKLERTAILLRSYTGYKYTQNDIQVIRALVSELALRTGGRYQVFLLVQDRDNSFTPDWEQEPHEKRLKKSGVPAEFHSMTILWTEATNQWTYPRIPRNLAVVHTAQWMPVQQFARDHREFSYFWNWELDSRFTGNHYTLLESLAEFGYKQPRRGLWERNSVYYIPEVHGDYDTDFRAWAEKNATERDGEGVWGPAGKGFIRQAMGPQPPVDNPKDDPYVWGVDEEADLITLGPLFDPTKTNWIMRDEVYGPDWDPSTLPRRTTIITQARVSRRLIEVMHMENLMGHHATSEMMPHTIALLHGLKAVYAPMPVHFDTPWSGKEIEKWFNCGGSCLEDPYKDMPIPTEAVNARVKLGVPEPIKASTELKSAPQPRDQGGAEGRGGSTNPNTKTSHKHAKRNDAELASPGGNSEEFEDEFSSPVHPAGWGLEGQFEGSTWYYRTSAPQKLYHNFMGWEDTSIGGEIWEHYQYQDVPLEDAGAEPRPEGEAGPSQRRICLPPIILHPVKHTVETPAGFASEGGLYY